MRSFKRWLRRRRELDQQSPRRLEIESELAIFFGFPTFLTPAETKGGYDEIYYAYKNSHGTQGRSKKENLRAGDRFAVVRVNSPFKQQNDPIGPQDPGVPLEAKERLTREWNAYNLMAPLHLSPEPLWKTSDAIACSWFDWQRASQRLINHRSEFWSVMERIFPAIQKMHQCGVTHLDLNLGNILLEPEGTGVLIIDFEFGPVDWVDQSQQQAFDYLRVIDDCIKTRRGGNYLLANPERMKLILDQLVDTETRRADLAFIYGKLQRLKEQTALREKLKIIFSNLS